MFVAADVMLVTPLRDGMNLVAKEYVSCRNDLGGALVLSEFTGAWHELHQAFICNPHDIEGVKQTIMRAINAPEDERRRRMKAMRKRVADHDVQRWASRYLEALASAPARPIGRPGHHRERRGAERANRAEPSASDRASEGSAVEPGGQDLRIALAPSPPGPGCSWRSTSTARSLRSSPTRSTPGPCPVVSRRCEMRQPCRESPTAVVSGRDLATLEMLTGIGPDDGITLVGSHGAQTNRADRAGLGSTAGAACLDEAAAALLAHPA